MKVFPIFATIVVLISQSDQCIKEHFWAVSSAGLEHYLDKVGVTGSNPVQPTSYF